MLDKYIYPSRDHWHELIQRAQIDRATLYDSVQVILKEVKTKGDQALLEYTQKFDGVALNSIQAAVKTVQINQALKTAIDQAYENIEIFHKSQLKEEEDVETMPGIKCWRKSVGIQKVGLYIPGGTAPLFSSLLMLGIPAKLVGCEELIICSPPNKNGEIHEAILYIAQKLGVKQIYTVGGAQAIAAMAYGTKTIPNVHKIFGPGNQYVTAAKELISTEGVAIDMPAGPSEVLIIADQNCNAEYVAADLLSQAEHGPDSQVILVTNSETSVDLINEALERQLDKLPRASVAKKALQNSKAIICSSLDDCIDFSNEYAPEHLILAVQDYQNLQERVINAGSVFLGKWSCESLGDYASGTNHALPTYGYAKMYSGVSTDSFVKKITFQEVNEQGMKNIGPLVEIMAVAEGLEAHRNAVTLRLKDV